MQAERLPNGKILAPKRAEGANGLVGDGMLEIGPDDPDYNTWDTWLRRTETRSAGRPQSTSREK